MLGRIDTPPGPAVQVAGYLLLVAIAVADLVLAVRGRSWGPWRYPVLLILLAGYLAFTLMLPPGAVFTVDNWYFEAIGWFGVLLLFDRSLLSFLGFLLAYLAVTTVPVAVFGHADRSVLAGFGITAVSVGGFQTLTATAAGALRSVAASALAASAAAERTRTGRAVARQLHLDRQRRYRELAATAGPLLGGLADGSLGVEEEDVRRRCAIEAARMRRLFAETDDIDDRLLHELRACADIAERKGVLIELISQGSWPELPLAVRRALTDAPMRVLSTAAGTARVTVVGTPGSVSVSVVAEDATLPEPAETEGVRTASISVDNRVWVEATWQAAP
jgi:hypothetical protein